MRRCQGDECGFKVQIDYISIVGVVHTTIVRQSEENVQRLCTIYTKITLHFMKIKSKKK